MNKVFGFLFSLILCLISLWATFILRDYQQYSQLYKNKVSISISFNSQANAIEQVKKMDKLTEEKGITFSNIVSPNKNNYYMRTTNKRKVGNIKSRKKLDLIDNNTNIYVIPFFDDLTERSVISNIYWFESSTNELDSEELIIDLHENLEVNNITLVERKQTMQLDGNDYPTLVFLSISIVLVIFILLASNLKMLAILQMEGFGIIDICWWYIKKYRGALVLSVVLSSSAIGIFLITILKSSYFSTVLFLLVIYFVTMISFYGILMFSVCILKRFNRLDRLKNKQYYSLFSVLFSIVAIFSLVFYFFSSNELEDVYSYSQKLVNEKKNWEKTENFYKLFLTYSGEKDIKRERATSQQLALFYKKAVKENQGLFVMDSSNYYPLGNSFIYEQNEGDELASPGGKKITITPNYLVLNPIFSKMETKKIINQIVRDDSTRNILVPEKLQPLEASIRKNYLEDFNFKKNIVGSIYSEEMGDEPVSSKQKLTMNIIYVPNNVSYFSYDINTAFTKIIDPIVELETFNIDISYFNMYASAFTYFHSIKKDPYEFITLNTTNNSQNIQVKSVYTELSDDIASNKQRISRTLLQTIVMLTALSIILYSWINAFYLLQKKKIHLKILQGNTYWHINQALFFATLLIACISIGVGWLLNSVNYVNVTFLLIYLIITFLSCSAHFYNTLKRMK